MTRTDFINEIYAARRRGGEFDVDVRRRNADSLVDRFFAANGRMPDLGDMALLNDYILLGGE